MTTNNGGERSPPRRFPIPVQIVLWFAMTWWVTFVLYSMTFDSAGAFWAATVWAVLAAVTVIGSDDRVVPDKENGTRR